MISVKKKDILSGFGFFFSEFAVPFLSVSTVLRVQHTVYIPHMSRIWSYGDK